jgi:hypothetical protein
MLVVMGWRDRDWAKFTDDEWQAIYGFRPQRAVYNYRAPRAELPRRRRVNRVRRYVWSGLAVATVAALVATASTRPTLPSTPHSVAPPTVLYGIRGTQPTGDAPGGTNTVCTEFVRSSQTLPQCIAWTINDRRVTVIPPASFDDGCAHARVDQTQGSWRCLTHLSRVGPGA